MPGLFQSRRMRFRYRECLRLPTGVATVAITAAISATTAKTSATTFTARLRLRFVHTNRAAIERLSIQRVDRCLRLRAIRHLDKAEAFRATVDTIGHNTR